MEEDYDWYDYWEEDQVDNSPYETPKYGTGLIDPKDYHRFNTAYFEREAMKEEWKEMDDIEYAQWENMFNYHPTTGNINVKSLEKLPYHEKLWEHDGYRRYHYRTPYHREKAYRIFKASVGRPLHSLRLRLKPLLKRMPGESFKHLVQSWSDRVKFYEDGTYDVLDRYGAPGPTYFTKHGNYHYVDTEDKLQYVPHIAREKHPLTNQEHFAYQQKRRDSNRQYKKDRKTRGIIDIKLINKPALRSFYLNTKSSYESLVRKDREYNIWFNLSPEEKLKERKRHSWYYMKPYPISNSDRIEMEKLKDIVYQIEHDDYSSYYRSPNYLFSIGKECPHFEQP